MPSKMTDLVYIDDSGDPRSGLAVYGWVEFEPDRWASVLGAWLDHRKALWRNLRVPVVEELHTTNYVHGRGRIATKVPDRHVHEGVAYWKDFGREVAQGCIETLSSIEGLTVGAVYRRGGATGIYQTKAALYAELVAQREAQLDPKDGLALLFMDGDGSDPIYRTAHRGLPLKSRRVIEDAIHLDSRGSQLMQMADLVAWTAYSAIEQPLNNVFAHEWDERYLAHRDPHRRPREI